MATSHTAKPQSFRDGMAIVWGILRKPKAFVPLLLLFAKPLWLPPILYFSLWLISVPSLSYVPQILIVLLIGLGAGTCIGVFILMGLNARRFRDAKKAASKGDAGSEEALVAARARVRSAPIHFLFAGQLAISVSLPIIVALVGWTDMQKPEVIQSHGKTITLTPDRQLHIQLDGLRERGIFNPF